MPFRVWRKALRIRDFSEGNLGQAYIGTPSVGKGGSKGEVEGEGEGEGEG